MEMMEPTKMKRVDAPVGGIDVATGHTASHHTQTQGSFHGHHSEGKVVSYK